MIIQPLYMRTGVIVNPPDEYIPRTREAVEFLIREDMITAVAERWTYPGAPESSNYNNYDHIVGGCVVSILDQFVDRTHYVNASMEDRRLNSPDIETAETAIVDYSMKQYYGIVPKNNGVVGGNIIPFSEYYLPICFFGGIDDSHQNGKINHKRSYTGTGIGVPFYDTPTYFSGINTYGLLNGINVNYELIPNSGLNQIDKATGNGGGDRVPFVDNSIPANTNRSSLFSRYTKYPADPYITGNNYELGYSFVMRESPRELPEDPDPHITTHYRITFDCASCLKVTHPNLKVITNNGTFPLYQSTYKWYNRLEPSGIVAIKSIGAPTTSIILGSKDGTGHGKYLEEFNMEYGGVGPDCFNANCIRIKEISFEKYYPTSYFYRNGSYLNGVDGQTMGSLYKGCLLLESVPAMNFDLIDYDGFFYNCNKLKSIGSNGLSGLYQNAMSMDGFLYGLSSYDSQITISAPKLSSFANNNNCTKLPKIIINQSNFRSRANASQPWTVVFEMSGLHGMTLDSICETLETIYNYEVVVNGGRLDKLQFKFGNNSLMSTNSPRFTAISNLISSVGGNAVVYNI